MALTAEHFELMGKFYLGRTLDPETGQATDVPLLYDSKDLVTHAVCVGMTGSGKTGLCVGLLEEAAIDGVPALIIDPKGDLTNLALQFPDLSPEEFAPWVPPGEAERRASGWKAGLARWGQDGERIRRLAEAAEVRIYTPGSTAGTPISVVAAFDPPAAGVRADAELLAEAIETAAVSLLGLLGVSTDPTRSRELTLVSAILQDAWGRGESVSLTDLVGTIQKPAFDRIGVLDLESFYPAKERFDLVLALNNLLASPGFAVWRDGVPLEVGGLLFTPEGKPRLAVVSIAHLSEGERMFFVALLLNAVVSWVRSQPGTTSLRALVYMDEVFGYFPPVANPPSKKPLLTLMKQARAHGLGVVLATQNPADLDYKGLSNAGTWFVGRLQTERDKSRLLEGLRSVSGGVDLDALLAGLGDRKFLLNSVHEDGPVKFETRWALSYLAGPLTREQIRRFAGPTSPLSAKSAADDGRGSSSPPVLEGVDQVFEIKAVGATMGPRMLIAATVRYRDRTHDFDETRDGVWLLPIPSGLAGMDWSEAVEVAADSLGEQVPSGVVFGNAPNWQAQDLADWKREALGRIVADATLAVFACPAAAAASGPDESERDFRVRLGQRLRELRDERSKDLRVKYGRRQDSLATKIARARETVDREEAQAGQARFQTAMSFGSTLLGVFLGRKSVRGATTAARGVGRSMKEAGDVGRARDKLAGLEREMVELESELRAELAAAADELNPATVRVERTLISAMKTGTRVRTVALAWVAD